MPRCTPEFTRREIEDSIRLSACLEDANYCDALRKCSSAGRLSRRESIRFARGPVAKANHATQESVCSSESGDNPSMNIPPKGRKLSGARRIMSNGRSEKRIARTVSVEVRFPDGLVQKERTSTENVSAHGARLFIKQRLKPGQAVLLVSPTEGVGCQAQIVYCQHISESRFAVGLELHGRVEAWTRAY